MRTGYRKREHRPGLIVSRVVGETLEIKTQHGEAITIEVARVNGGSVRLRAFADPSVRFRRGELAAEPAGPIRPHDSLAPECNSGDGGLTEAA